MLFVIEWQSFEHVDMDVYKTMHLNNVFLSHAARDASFKRGEFKHDVNKSCGTVEHLS